MSSAILYVAIVVIWACVLIPRWLRRDSSGSASGAEEQGEVSAETGAEEGAPPVPAPVSAPVSASRPVRASGPAPEGRRREVVDEAPRQERRVADDRADSADPVNQRVLSARRRLLLMLIGLSIASGVLAGTRMAAWWVIVPPSVMLLGYLPLLREASKADAERREVARHRAARAAAESARAAERRPAPVAPVAKVIAFLPPPEEQLYDQYADAKLRAVGD